MRKASSLKYLLTGSFRMISTYKFLNLSVLPISKREVVFAQIEGKFHFPMAFLCNVKMLLRYFFDLAP